MEIVNAEAGGQSHARDRTGEMGVALDVTVESGFPPLKQRDHIAELAFFEPDVERK
jgi:hypothetical protein